MEIQDYRRSMLIEIPQLMTTESFETIIREIVPGVIVGEYPRKPGSEFDPPMEGDVMFVRGRNLPAYAERNPGERVIRMNLSEILGFPKSLQVRPANIEALFE
jgi:hypothetical protein